MCPSSPELSVVGCDETPSIEVTTMKAKQQKTFSPKPADITREWFVVDATDQTLGRLASDIAQILRGKHKPTYAPHFDGGDFVVVVNAEKVAVTGKKELQKVWYLE